MHNSKMTLPYPVWMWKYYQVQQVRIKVERITHAAELKRKQTTVAHEWMATPGIKSSCRRCRLLNLQIRTYCWQRSLHKINRVVITKDPKAKYRPIILMESCHSEKPVECNSGHVLACDEYGYIQEESPFLCCLPGARATKHISIEFEIRWKFKTL